MTAPRQERIRLPKLRASDFQHPLDIAALDAVKQARGLDFIVRKLNEYGWERWFRVTNVADNVRVTPRQCKRLHDLLREACAILAVPEPELYLDQDPIVNAYTFGTEQPFIVLQSGLVDFLSEDELLGVIAHELGHIKCGHVLYKMMANFLSLIIERIGEATFGLGALVGSGLLLALYEWDRKAELSCDRAGLLVVQDIETYLTLLLKLAGGSRAVFDQLNTEEFLRQADDYEELDRDLLSRVYKFLQVYRRTHSFPAVRAREIKGWAEAGDYQAILDGSYWMRPARPDDSLGWRRTPPPAPPSGDGSTGAAALPVCPACGAGQPDPQARFCYQCGHPMERPAPPRRAPEQPRLNGGLRCPNCDATISKSDVFCPVCGLNTQLG
ncbi:MAG: peptidase M48 [Chloracidobacterium sp. CP2_5A]|nr:MAG: peptidase M48 [Chloracidobacterium sp. CP2_5A]